jgi:hypothetical protein
VLVEVDLLQLRLSRHRAVRTLGAQNLVRIVLWKAKAARRRDGVTRFSGNKAWVYCRQTLAKLAFWSLSLFCWDQSW